MIQQNVKVDLFVLWGSFKLLTSTFSDCTWKEIEDFR